MHSLLRVGQQILIGLGGGRPFVVRRATITVSMWRFISSGEMTRQGRVLRISRPLWDRVAQERHRTGKLPRPVFPIPLGRGYRFTINELVISAAVHLLKGLVPPGPCFGYRANDQLALLDFKIDRPMQVALLKQLTVLGLAADLAGELVAKLPSKLEPSEAERLMLAQLARRIATADERWLDHGGIVAMGGK